MSSSARDPLDLPEVPAVAVCATCGDPSCAGHDHEVSGERPTHRQFPWEDGETPPMRAVWLTSMASAGDLDLWIAASQSDRAIAPPLTFAILCELFAVGSTALPIAAVIAGGVWWLTRSALFVGDTFAFFGRVGAGLVPIMIGLHVSHTALVAHAASRVGKKAPIAHAIRAGLFACGWDLATGPAGVLAALGRGDGRQALARIRGNSTLYRTATVRWIDAVHGLDAAHAPSLMRAAWPAMIVLILLAVALVAWSLVVSFS